MDTLFDQLYQGVNEMLQNKKIKLTELVSILGPTMVLIETLAADKSGSQKKELLIVVFKKIITESDLAEENKNGLIRACDTIIPPLVDTIIAASKGDLELNINQITSCFPCLGKKKK